MSAPVVAERDVPRDASHFACLRVRDASVAVSGRRLWHGLDLELAPGRFAAVLGPNGVGKSTFIRAILGQHPLVAGSISVLGAPAGRDNQQIGYLPQRRSFDPGTRVRGVDIVRLGYDGSRYGVPLPFGPGRRRADAAVAEVLDLVGGSQLAGRPIGQLSGGEQQRLLIAAALVRKPRLLLLDEPLDSLDLPYQATIAGLIGRVCRERGIAVVMVAHDVNPILSHLDTVVYLASGGVAVGHPEEVITSERLTALFGTPIEVLHTSDGRPVVVGTPEAPAHHTDRHPDQDWT